MKPKMGWMSAVLAGLLICSLLSISPVKGAEFFKASSKAEPFKKESSIDPNVLTPPDPFHMQRIVTSSGEVLLGRVVQVSDGELEFESLTGTVYLSISEIEDFTEIQASRVRNGKYWFPNPNSGRLFVAQTGRPEGKGTGYVADYYILVPVAFYGLTKNVMIGGGATFINALPFAGFYFLPRVGFSITDEFAVTVGGGWVKALGAQIEEYFSHVGFMYAAATIGPEDASVTGGIGYGFFSDKEWSTEQGQYVKTAYFAEYPGVMLGGEFRVARWLSIVTENYLIHDLWTFRPVVSYGLRGFNERFSVDIGMIHFLAAEENKVIKHFPFVGLAFNY